jgi:hypothetical protein
VSEKVRLLGQHRGSMTGFKLGCEPYRVCGRV